MAAESKEVLYWNMFLSEHFMFAEIFFANGTLCCLLTTDRRVSWVFVSFGRFGRNGSFYGFGLSLLPRFGRALPSD